MEQPLISAIIPVYNMEAYLARCLDSILANTYRNLEIICIDDGSQDRSPEILHRYAEADSRVRVIAKPNGGVSSARNAGLDQISGEYISFIDPDDFVHPQFFAFLWQATAAAHADMSLCGFQSVEQEDLPLQFAELSFEPDRLTVIDCLSFFKTHNYRSFCWGRLIRAELLRDVRFREEISYSEDSLFIAEIGEHNPTMRIAVLPDSLYEYFQRENSLIKQVKLDGRLSIAEIYTEKALTCKENESIYLDQAIKRSLSTRYLAAYILPNREITKKCTILLQACRQRLTATTIYSKKEKRRNGFFIRFPRAYWLYRSIKEPNMRRWEVVERRKRREARRTQA